MAVASIVMLVLSCGDGAVGPATPPAPVATTVTVNPSSAALTALEETVRLAAEVRDQNGQVMTGATVAWASSDALVAVIEASGQVTAVGNGATTITATAGSASGTATVTVTQEVSAVALSPATDTLVAFGDTVRLAAEAVDANGHAVAAVTAFEWASSDTLVASVDDSGLVESVAAGEAVVTATASGVTGQAELSVVPPLPTTVAVSPDTVRFTALGQTVQFAAEVREQSGRVMGEALVSWSSGDTLVASVDSTGLVTAEGAGTTTVIAAAGDASGAVVVTVMQSAGSVVVSPSEGTVALDDTLRLTAEAFDENGHRVDGAAFSWSSSDPAVARVAESGLVTGVALGTTTISATSGDASGTAEITVENPDRAALVALYEATAGPDWVTRDNWLTDVPLREWHGVETDRRGRVTGLELGDNGLSGVIPPELGNLANLERLDLGWNRFGGEIPAILGQLSDLRILNLRGNALSGSIPAELGGLAMLGELNLSRNELTGSIPPELGELANLTHLWLDDNLLSGPVPLELTDLNRLAWLNLERNQLTGRIPSEFGDLGAVEYIGLADNQLVGAIPPELGGLRRLSELHLSGNHLAGPIPEQLGGLASLQRLRLSGNDLTNSIPPELGGLADLTMLDLTGNQLSGSIPAELGRLANLETLHLGNNQLSGPLPAELGQARKLESLDLRSNALAGLVPPGFGDLTLLTSLILANNPDLAGPLPTGITALSRLEQFMTGGTGLCLPSDPRLVEWFGAIANRLLARCRDDFAVYLTQAVQSWDHPVPLLAGEPALLRVFVTATRASTATMPPVRATFYLNGVERHAVDIAASTNPIPTDVTEGDLALSVNAEIPEWIIAPGLEMVIEVDPEGTLDAALGVTKRIPDSGRIAVDVRPVPLFHLTLIPFLLAEDPDSSAVDDVSAMAADPDGHDLLSDVRALLPVAELDVAAREAVMVSTPDIIDILRQVEAMRIMEGGAGYWMGIWDGRQRPGSYRTAVGVAHLGGRASASVRRASTIAHELGHNLSLQHAPCGSPNGVDPWFPHAYGSIGAWGYDFERHTLVTPDASDIMSYCGNNRLWISDYFFNKALDYRLTDDGSATAAMTSEADPVRSLLVWGGRDQDGVPYLDPGFVVDATPSLPPAGSEFTIEGATADGIPLFSFTFDMPDIADGAGEEASFVFALPVQAGWADDLASITLSGPGGSATLDQTTDQPMAILRDPRTGQIRGFLRDPDPATQAVGDAVGGVVGQGMEVLFSRGIPGPADWWREW
ncbi:MAG: Ig-like domain-containing protein [Gemmatimonadota bacterium]|nr:Ig-like domain-containing protein [Gemmatimonadota bacterium]MDE2865054.1 Ig-like domain-containing protein [Gemmatimonadota bacterium]